MPGQNQRQVSAEIQEMETSPIITIQLTVIVEERYGRV